MARIVVERVDAVHGHASFDASPKSRLLVGAEVHAGARAQQEEDFPEAVLFVWLSAKGRWRVSGSINGYRGPAAQPRQLPRDLLGGQDEVHTAGSNRAPRHVLMLGRSRVLGEGDAPLGPDRLEPERPVRSHARKDHADAEASLDLGQGPQERIDGHMRATGLAARHELQHPLGENDVLGGRNDVDPVRFHEHVALHLGDDHCGGM
jgi:hypothetical protein